MLRRGLTENCLVVLVFANSVTVSSFFLSSSLQSLLVRFARFLSAAAELSHDVKKPRNGSSIEDAIYCA